MIILSKRVAIILSALVIILPACSNRIASPGDAPPAATVDSVSALRSIDLSVRTPGITIKVRGYYHPNDDGGGIYIYKSAAPLPDNAGTIIVPNDGLGAWMRKPTQSISVKCFGAKGDGINDDAPAIEATVAALSAAGGGRCIIPAGTYLLGTLSSDPASAYAYIVPRSSVDIVGSGMDATILRVKSGENHSHDKITGPNVIATAQAAPLANCRFTDFTVSWDPYGNKLSQTDKRRNNAAIFSLNGGSNILVERVGVTGTPGNQCIFFPATEDAGQGNITVRHCIFKDNGSGLEGNFNDDHSSVYLNGKNIRIEYCIFTSRLPVRGTCFELHGTNASATNNTGNNYRLGFYCASNFESLSNLLVRDCAFTDVHFAFSISAEKFAVDDVQVINCTFTQNPDATYSYGHTFINGNTISSCRSLDVVDCKFEGKGAPNLRLLSLQRIRNFNFRANLIENFANYGITTAGLEIGAGRWADSLSITNNRFINVHQPIYLNAPKLSVGQVVISGNEFMSKTKTGTPAISMGFPSALSIVKSNRISPQYTDSKSW